MTDTHPSGPAGPTPPQPDPGPSGPGRKRTGIEVEHYEMRLHSGSRLLAYAIRDAFGWVVMRREHSKLVSRRAADTDGALDLLRYYAAHVA